MCVNLNISIYSAIKDIFDKIKFYKIIKKMKKLIYLPLLSFLIAGVISCETETELVEIPEATIQRIADAAAGSVTTPSASEIASAVEAAIVDDINAGLEEALVEQTLLTNPPLENVGNGGITRITTEVTWTNDKIWIMDGKIIVDTGGILNIEAGTIIKAQNGQAAEATTLVVTKNGTINANGTAEHPIIFTDVEDDITYANAGVSPNRRLGDRGKWGSIVLLGDATVGEDGGTEDIEGIVSGYDFTNYGGSDDSHSAGSMTYVSIRHSGTAIANGDELQGLTMGGVGNGTTIENIEIIGSKDDGIEIFGGSVNVTNLLIINHKDDGIDLDEAYKGTITNAVVVMASDSDGPFEIDGTEDSTGSITGEYTVQNVTVYGNSEQEDTATMGTWKSGATGLNHNVVYLDFPVGSMIQDIESSTYAGSGTATVAGQLLFNDFDFVGAHTLSTIMTVPDDSSFSYGSGTWGEVVSTQAASTGADLSVFGWTQL